MNDYRTKFYQRYVSSQLRNAAPKSPDDFKARRPFLTNLIDKHFPPNRDARIVDLGCGHGTLVYFAQRAGYVNVSGVDASAEQVRTAERLGIAQIAEGQVMETLKASADASFHAVVAFDLIEHMTKSELVDFVCEVRRVLKPSGRFIVHTPNAGSPFFGTIRYGDYTHEQAFTSSSITQLLITCDFDRVDCYEDVPIVHGIKSALRSLIWKTLRLAMAVYVSAETGTAKGSIFSQNFLTVGFVAGDTPRLG